MARSSLTSAPPDLLPDEMDCPRYNRLTTQSVHTVAVTPLLLLNVELTHRIVLVASSTHLLKDTGRVMKVARDETGEVSFRRCKFSVILFISLTRPASRLVARRCTLLVVYNAK